MRENKLKKFFSGLFKKQEPEEKELTAAEQLVVNSMNRALELNAKRREEESKLNDEQRKQAAARRSQEWQKQAAQLYIINCATKAWQAIGDGLQTKKEASGK